MKCGIDCKAKIILRSNQNMKMHEVHVVMGLRRLGDRKVYSPQGFEPTTRADVKAK